MPEGTKQCLPRCARANHGVLNPALNPYQSLPRRSQNQNLVFKWSTQKHASRIQKAECPHPFLAELVTDEPKKKSRRLFAVLELELLVGVLQPVLGVLPLRRLLQRQEEEHVHLAKPSERSEATAILSISICGIMLVAFSCCLSRCVFSRMYFGGAIHWKTIAFPFEVHKYCGWTKSCTTWDKVETIIYWHLQGNRMILGILSWCERISSIHSAMSRYWNFPASFAVF